MVGPKPFPSVAVIGGGAWGTALANLCAHNGVKTTIWVREPFVAEAINNQHENIEFLPGVVLAESMTATSEMADLRGADAYLFVAPAQHARNVLSVLKTYAATNAPVALCSKGIEQSNSLLMTEVLSQVWPSARPAVLSGPSFAKDVALGLPTAITLACPNKSLGEQWAATVGARHFRPYLTDDLIGAELGGAVKNVLAIAAGAVTGKGFGESARAALIARGFAEFQRLGMAIGAKPETMAGLSGLGDLILTASSAHSRNMSLGIELGKGRAIDDILRERNTVSEGAASAAAVIALAQRAGVEMPVCESVAALVAGDKSIDQIIEDLLARPFKTEAK